MAESIDNLATLLKTDNKWNISVIRRNRLSTAMEQIKAAEDIDWDKKIKVNFVGEDGVDAGGLTREFFSLLFRQSKIFDGGLFNFTSDLFADSEYMVMGKMVAMAVLHGHAGRRCLHPHLVKFMLTGDIPECSTIPTQHIPKAEVVTAINKIESIGSDNEKEVRNEYLDMLELAGFARILTTTNKYQAINALKAYFMFFRGLPPTLQFMDGLKLHGVLDVMKTFPEDSAAILLTGSQTSALDVKEFFLPLYSVTKEEKELEEVIIFNLHTFLQKVERGRVSTRWVKMDKEGTPEENVQINMTRVLQALLGSTALPTNISSGIVEFDHSSVKNTTVNTCAPSICMSNIKDCQSYSKFEMDFVNIVVAYGFGVQ